MTVESTRIIVLNQVCARTTCTCMVHTLISAGCEAGDFTVCQFMIYDTLYI